jgi:hypothetical protein
MEGIRAAIERHLRANPLAADTAKGIATCWLPQYGIEPAYEPFVEALQAMVLSRQLRAVELPGGELFYRRGPALAID